MPITADIPGGEQDTEAVTEPLLLYRLLGPSDVPTGNLLRVIKIPFSRELLLL